TEALRHPLFDASSIYGRTRARARAADKMRGHIHWMAGRARKRQLPFPQASALSENERRELAAALAAVGERSEAFEVLDAMPVDVLVLVAGAPAIQPEQLNGASGEGAPPGPEAPAPQALAAGS